MARIKGQLKIKDLGGPSEAKLTKTRTPAKQPEAAAERCPESSVHASDHDTLARWV